MKLGLWTSSLVAMFLSSVVSAAGPVVDCEMLRLRIPIAEADRQVTMAVELLAGLYDAATDASSVRRSCAELPASESRRFPECVVLAEFDARKRGDVAGRSLLFEQGASREQSLAQIVVEPGQLRQEMAGFTDVRLTGKVAWDSYLIINYVMVGDNVSFPWTLHLKKVGAEYWATTDIRLENMIHSILYFVYHRDRVLPADALAGLQPLRVTLAPDAAVQTMGIQINNNVPPHRAPDDRSVLLFLRPLLHSQRDRFVTVDVAQLDPGALRLRNALDAYRSDTGSVNALAALWRSEERESVAENLRLRAEAGYPPRSTLSFGNAIDQLRVHVRVEADEGMVWYGTAPKVDGSQRVVTMLQVRENGQTLLGRRFPTRAVSEILTNTAVGTYLVEWAQSQR